MSSERISSVRDVITSWNLLPEDIKEAGNVGQFKRLYKRHIGSMVAPALGAVFRIRIHLNPDPDPDPDFKS